MRGLNGKIGVVAGGGRGIGAATAMRLADEGALVVVGDINEEWAKDSAAAITKKGGKAIGVLSIDTEWGQSAGNAMEENIKALGGNFALRPVRPAAMLAKYPASTRRVLKPKGCAA